MEETVGPFTFTSNFECGNLARAERVDSPGMRCSDLSLNVLDSPEKLLLNDLKNSEVVFRYGNAIIGMVVT